MIAPPTTPPTAETVFTRPSISALLFVRARSIGVHTVRQTEEIRLHRKKLNCSRNRGFLAKIYLHPKMVSFHRLPRACDPTSDFHRLPRACDPTSEAVGFGTSTMSRSATATQNEKMSNRKTGTSPQLTTMALAITGASISAPL